MQAYFIYVLAFPSGKTYGCFLRKTWPTRLQGTISRLPPHIHTLKEISARQPRPLVTALPSQGGDTQVGSFETWSPEMPGREGWLHAAWAAGLRS